MISYPLKKLRFCTLGVFVLLCFLFFVKNGMSQHFEISGHVYDKDTKEPLSFVNIVINSSNQGGVSDINGRFRLTSTEEPQTLRFSYVGYEAIEYQISLMHDLKIYLQRSEIVLDEVIIVPGENPAHRIIEAVVANRDNNNPEKRSSFEYKSHNKLSFSIDTDALLKSNANDTSLNKEALDMLDKTYLMLIESITHRKFLYPNNNSEVVLASRVSGLKDPMLSLLASQLQTFSFYNEHITILDKRFLNPISRGSTNRYLFILEDTTYNNNDTVFIISYRPRINRNFEGLKGLLYINTNGYAIQYVTARPAEGNISNFDINIRQAYELINNKYWFPVQLNTELSYTYPDAIKLTIIGDGRSYLKDIEIDGKMFKRDFDNIAFEISKNAADRDEEFWERYRYEPLTEKDIETYRLIDSLSKVHNFNRLTNLMKALLEGKLPVSFLSIDLSRIVNYNNYNGWRFGLGLETNDKISSFFNVGGYMAYSLRNHNWRYGAHLRMNIDRKKDMALNYSFINDDIESAPVNSFDYVPRLQLNDYRSYLISITDNTFAHRASFSFRPYKYVLSRLAYSYAEVEPNYRYMFVENDKHISILRDRFTFSEFSLNFRFAYKESFIFADNYKVSLGTKYPIINFGFKKGLKDFNKGEFDYTRFDLEIDMAFYIKLFGLSRFIIHAGYISGDLPYSRLYNACGSYEKYTVFSPFTFSTMRINEFLSDRYAALLYQHNFGSLLFKRNNFKPEIVLVNNIYFGDLNKPELHRYFDFNTVEKGYFESGIVLNDLLRSSFYGLGAGVFYRYGAYTFPEIKNNFALQMSLKITL